MSNSKTTEPAAGRSKRKGATSPAAPTSTAPSIRSRGADAPPAREKRGDTLIALMRAEGGASAAELAAAVGWQLHSVRGFIAGALKKRADLTVSTAKVDGVTRYSICDAPATGA